MMQLYAAFLESEDDRRYATNWMKTSIALVGSLTGIAVVEQ